jgi:hypothetical protein
LAEGSSVSVVAVEAVAVAVVAGVDELGGGIGDGEREGDKRSGGVDG